MADLQGPPRVGDGPAAGEPPPEPAFDRSLSSLFARLQETAGAEGARISVADLMDALGSTSVPALLLVIALPAIVMPPGPAAALGAPMLLLSTQLAAGRRTPWLPRACQNLAIEGRRASTLLGRLSRVTRRLEQLVRPRAGSLLHPAHVRVVAVACMALSAVLLTPAPIAHSAAGLGIVAFAAGLVRRDGLAILCGWAFSAVCAALVAVIVWAAFQAARLV